MSQEAVVLFSDWHIGALYNLSRNQFSLQIAERRLCAFLDTFAADFKMRGGDVIHVQILGDMIHNETMRGSAKMECEFGFPMQQDHAARMLLDAIRFMEGLGPEVRCYGVVGNHGRAGRPGDNATASNYDNSVYLQVNRMLPPESPARIRISDDKYVSTRACGKAKHILGTHGDQVGGWGSIPLQRLIHLGYQASDTYGYAEIITWGHGHRGFKVPHGNKEYIGNGSLCGETPFTGERCGNARPQQTYFYVKDGRFGAFGYEMVDLQHIQGKRR